MASRFRRFREWMAHPGRNDTWYDGWSAVHIMTGIAVGWVMDPFIGLMLLVLWEPFEVFLLNPVIQRLFDFEFGFESLRNVLSDIVFDAAGVAFGFWVLRDLWAPPFVLP